MWGGALFLCTKCDSVCHKCNLTSAFGMSVCYVVVAVFLNRGGGYPLAAWAAQFHKFSSWCTVKQCYRDRWKLLGMSDSPKSLVTLKQWGAFFCRVFHFVSPVLSCLTP